MVTDADLLAELADLATSLGPAILPPGHGGMLTAITAAARHAFGAAAVSLAQLDEAEEYLTFVAATGAGADRVVGLQVPSGVGIAGWVVASGSPIEVSDVTRDPRFARNVADTTGYVPSSILAMPLETENAVLGVIEVLDRRVEGPAGAGEQDMVLLSLFARQAALAMDAADVFHVYGASLLTSFAAAVTERSDLRSVLATAAAGPRSRDRAVAELALLFAQLGTADAATRRLARRVLEEVVAFADQRRRQL